MIGPLIAILVIAFTTTCFGQKNKGYFLTPKAGIYIQEGFAFSMEGGMLKNNSLLALSYLHTSEFLGANQTKSLDATFGRFDSKGTSLFFHAQAGITMMWGETWDIDKGDTKSFSTAGLPLKAGFKYLPPQFLSLGIDFQFNINSKQSLYLIMLTLGVWHLNE